MRNGIKGLQRWEGWEPLFKRCSWFLCQQIPCRQGSAERAQATSSNTMAGHREHRATDPVNQSSQRASNSHPGAQLCGTYYLVSPASKRTQLFPGTLQGNEHQGTPGTYTHEAGQCWRVSHSLYVVSQDASMNGAHLPLGSSRTLPTVGLRLKEG